jgi:hypothetical protein
LADQTGQRAVDAAPVISGLVLEETAMAFFSRAAKKLPAKKPEAPENEDFKAIAALIHQLLPSGAPDFLRATQNSITQMAKTGGSITQTTLTTHVADIMHGYYKLLEAATMRNERFRETSFTRAGVYGLGAQGAAAGVTAVLFEIMTAGLAFEPFIQKNWLGFPLLFTQATLMTALMVWNTGFIRVLFVISSLAFAGILGYGASQHPLVSALGQNFGSYTSDSKLDEKTNDELVKVRAQLPALREQVEQATQALEQARRVDSTITGRNVNRRTTFGRSSEQLQTARNRLNEALGREAQLETKIETARGTDPARLEVQRYAWVLFSLLNGASSMVFMSMLGRARPAHREALARQQREKLMRDEITALRNNETKREALASKFLIGFRALYAEALKTGPSDRGAVSSKIDDAFGDIDRLAKESARLFVGMITPRGAASAPLPAVSPAPVGGHGGAPAGAASTQSLPRGKVGQNRLT